MTDWEDMIRQKQELRDELLEFCDGECDRCPFGKRIPADRGWSKAEFFKEDSWMCTLNGGDYVMGDQISRQAAIDAQQNSCEFWDDESNFCALHRPSAQHEIAEDAVKEWLHKRHLVAVDIALYTEMKRKCAGCCYEPVEGGGNGYI